ncbi:hypothetical protein ACSBR1_039216 [Camellia fascicularis]
MRIQLELCLSRGVCDLNPIMFATITTWELFFSAQAYCARAEIADLFSINMCFSLILGYGFQIFFLGIRIFIWGFVACFL